MPPGGINRGIAGRAALKAGLVGVVLGMIPFLGIVLTGALAIYFYRRASRLTPPAPVAMRLGGAAGVVAFAINAVLITIRIFVFHARQEYVDAILKVAQRFGTNVSDPEMQASIRNLFTPMGMATTFFFGLIVSLVLASVGGMIAAWVVRPRKRGA